MKTNLKRIREHQGKLQEEVAKDLGLSLSTYRSWEQGQRKLNGEKLSMLADYFNVSVDAIIGTDFTEPLDDPRYMISATDFEIELFDVISDLNREGLNKVLEYAQDLVASNRYQKKNVSDYSISDTSAAIA